MMTRQLFYDFERSNLISLSFSAFDAGALVSGSLLAAAVPVASLAAIVF